jgi:hypothetical protein
MIVTKKFLYLIGAFLIGSILFWYFALCVNTKTENSTIAKDEIQNTVSVPATTENFTAQLVASTTYIEAKVDYPTNNPIVKKWILDMYNDFVTSNQDEIKQEQKDFPDRAMRYAFDATYVVATSSEYTSYVYQIYNYTGGAHGSTVTNSYITNNKTGKRIESLTDIYNKDIYTYLQDYSRKDLRNQFTKNEDLKSMYDEKNFVNPGTEATADNYSAFWFEGDNLVVNFGQYQVAAYAAGTFDVSIPLINIEKYKK